MIGSHIGFIEILEGFIGLFQGLTGNCWSEF